MSIYLRLFIILIGFPVVLVYGFPELGIVQRFYGGDRTAWMAFWGLAAVLEWGTLVVVLASFKEKLKALKEIGFPFSLTKKEKIGFGLGLGGFVLLAILGAGTPQEFLANVPEGARMFVPPSDLVSRLFWVFMSLTAALVEETLWRGVAITGLKKLTGNIVIAVVIASFSFAFFHGGLDQGIGPFLMRFAIAVGLSALYLKTNSLKWPIAVHFMLDAVLLGAIQYD